MLRDPVLAFIKAHRLQGSSSNLKIAALSKFDSVVMSKAKKALWESDCSNFLSTAGLSYQQRCGSEKWSKAAADLDDILVAFDKLDEIDKLPEIFCEVVDLVLLPPIVADSCTELVQLNSSVLEAIELKLDSLHTEMSNFSSKMGNIESCFAGLPPQSNATAFGNDGSPPPGSSFKPPSRPRVSSTLTDWCENLSNMIWVCRPLQPNSLRNDLLNVNNDFLSCGVSGMDSSDLLLGRPFGGCAIFFRRSLLPFVSCLDSPSNQFCSLLLRDRHGTSTLLICVYLPHNDGSSASHTEYLITLGELEELSYFRSHSYCR